MSVLKKYGLVALHIELLHFRETHNALQLPVFFVFSFFSFFFHELIGNIGEFVAKKYFTDHRTANTIQLFLL